MMLKTTYVILLFSSFVAFGCKKEKGAGRTPEDEVNVIESRAPLMGMRIAWDYSSLRKVSDNPTGPGYNGYARVVQLSDQSLLLTYEARGSIVASKSSDLGNTWSAAVVVKAPEPGINMAVPDLLELKDGSVLIMYNPRPFEIDPSRKFQIRTKKSYDGGLTWKDERTVYSAGHEFENGCWEPSAIQLPDQEIQLFFANEGVYPSSNEQNISMVSSTDGGLTWSTSPKIASFRQGKRDGMPVPVVLSNQTEIAFAIEDNASGEFKPFVIKNTIADKWSSVVDGESKMRSYALMEQLNSNIYAGAPYLRQLSTGETLLSYQGTEGRINNINNADMKVVIGSSSATNFTNKTVPFKIPATSSALWNSLSVLDDNTVIALTTTNAYGTGSEVWMIKGYPVYDSEAVRGGLEIDGRKIEALWNAKFPVFAGHQGASSLKSNFAYDDNYLYVVTEAKDQKVYTASSNLQENDGITCFIDAGNKSYRSQAKGTYSFYLSADNKLAVQEGNNGKWILKSDVEGVKTASTSVDGGYIQEIAIPWSSLGGRPEAGSRIGMTMMITENSGASNADYKEPAVLTISDQPFTWLTLKLK